MGLAAVGFAGGTDGDRVKAAGSSRRPKGLALTRSDFNTLVPCGRADFGGLHRMASLGGLGVPRRCSERHCKQHNSTGRGRCWRRSRQR